MSKVQATKKCSICTHPQREEIHKRLVIEKAQLKDVGLEFFPDRKPGTSTKALRKHLDKHFPVADVVEQLNNQQGNVTLPATVAPLTPLEKQVFTEAVRQDVDTLRTVESMMKTLMDRANHIQEEWSQIHSKTKCTSCGRDDTSQNLVRMLAVFRELREQSDSWTKLRNPMGAVQKMAEKTFLQFVEEMTEMYVSTLTEKARLVRDASNDFLEGRINQALFAKRIAEAVDDFGGNRISESAQEKYARIMGAALKELKL